MTFSGDSNQPISVEGAIEVIGQLEASTIATQNDKFRTTWGAERSIPGRIVMTAAMANRGIAWTTACMAAVQRFDGFDTENDPHGEHNFASVEVTVGTFTSEIFFKIDLYDTAYKHGSEDPSNANATRRVMTLMFPSDY